MTRISRRVPGEGTRARQRPTRNGRGAISAIAARDKPCAIDIAVRSNGDHDIAAVEATPNKAIPTETITDKAVPSKAFADKTAASKAVPDEAITRKAVSSEAAPRESGPDKSPSREST
ncbi:MAG: hypothetical protein ACRYHQ_01580 [Janthinobacterium lividum]